MDFETLVSEWTGHGFVCLPTYIRPDELAPAVRTLDSMFPTADGFHDGTDPRRGRFVGDEFDGIDSFPFASVEVSLLAVHDRIVELARRLLATDDIRLYSAEAWAKFTGADDYDQLLHRDYLNHTMLAPTTAPAYQQVEMFLFLVDVPAGLGPPHLVSQTLTADMPAKPNWLPRTDREKDPTGFVADVGRRDLYDAEVSTASPAGTVVAFKPGTFHRGTGMTDPRGARYTMHLGFRPTGAEWAIRHGWAERSHEPDWYRFVSRATPQQLQMFGFPPPGHPYWTPETIAAVSQRYPELDMSAWATRLP